MPIFVEVPTTIVYVPERFENAYELEKFGIQNLNESMIHERISNLQNTIQAKKLQIKALKDELNNRKVRTKPISARKRSKV